MEVNLLWIGGACINRKNLFYTPSIIYRWGILPSAYLFNYFNLKLKRRKIIGLCSCD